MEGVSSSPQNNDELVDNLVSRHFIRSSNVERVFRAVERADFMPPENLDQAYEDLEWRIGPLHLLAPSTYSVVMEALELKPGLSFLNIGSGTGYLSTLAGLILGTAGISHGVEVNLEVLEYAQENMQWFLDTSLTWQEIDFCVPKFYHGNGLCLSQPLTGYDRVYCGGNCPGGYDNYLKTLIKVGGVLVMPFNNTVVQVRRVAENKWTSSCLYDVFFFPLHVPNAEDASNPVKLDAQTPVRLQLLARAAIRAAMYRGVISRNPMLAERPRSPAPAARPRSLAPAASSRCSCLPLEPGYSNDEDLNLLEYGRSFLNCNEHRANLPSWKRDLAKEFMDILAETDAFRLSADTATSYRMSPVLPAETTPGEATDAIISQDPKSVPPRPDLPGMPSEVEIDPGKMAQTEVTTSPSEMVWEDTRRDSLEGSEDETDTPKSKPKRQKLDSGIGENTPSGSSPDKSNNSESDGCLPCGCHTAEPEDTFHGRGFDLRRGRGRVAFMMVAALRELPLPHLLKVCVNFGRSYYYCSNYYCSLYQNITQMIKPEPWTGGTNEEYETQHFGFGAQRFKAAVRKMVEEKIQSCCKEMEESVKEAKKLSDEDSAALTKACEKLVSMYCERAGPSFSIIDEHIDQMMQVPQNVLLPEDEVQLNQTTEEEYEKLQEEVVSLRKRVEQSSLFAALLTAEEEELSSLEKVCETAKKDMDALEALEKNLEDGTEKLQNLLNEVQELKESLPFKQECDLFDD